MGSMRPTGSLRPQGHQGQGGGSHVTWAKSTEATRPSCRVFWMWSQERLRLSEGDISLRTAAQRSWSCSGQVGEQRVVCSSATQGFSSLGGGGASPLGDGPGKAAPPCPAMPQGHVRAPPAVFCGRNNEEEPPQGVQGVGTPVLLPQQRTDPGTELPQLLVPDLPKQGRQRQQPSDEGPGNAALSCDRMALGLGTSPAEQRTTQVSWRKAVPAALGLL